MFALTIYLLCSGCFACGFVLFGLTDADPAIADVSLPWRLFGAVVAALLWPVWIAFAAPIAMALVLNLLKLKRADR